MKNQNRLILDCTLRDGGYVNNWDFSGDDAVQIIQSLVNARVDMVECGFVSQKKGRADSTCFPGFDEVNSLLGRLEIPDGRCPMFLIMINLGEFDLEDMPEASSVYPGVQGIRLAFHKKQWREAVEQAPKIISKGYRLFVQPMLTVAYSDREILDLLDAFHPLDYHAMYIVDTFGSMSGEQFRRYHALFENNLKAEARLGYHSHNNLQLAYSNAITFLDLAHTREIIIDSSILGMGRGAGNLNTELLAGYMNDRLGTGYLIDPLLEVIDSYLEDIKRDHPWGYSIAHFLSAGLNCHPNYSGFLLGKKNLTVREIKDLLEQIPEDQRVRYDPDLIKRIYQESRRQIRREERLPADLFGDRPVMAVASGPSVRREAESIHEFREKRDPLVVALNHIPDLIEPDYIFVSNQKRYDEFAERFDPNKLILSTNLDVRPAHVSCITIDYGRLLADAPVESDNVAILFLSLVLRLGISELAVAGLDGYSFYSPENYSYAEHAGPREQEVMEARNEELRMAVRATAGSLKFHFVTRSQFEREVPLLTCGVIPARYQSSRFEGKPLAPIAGVPMLKRTYDRVKDCPGLDHLVVATDDDRIREFCEGEGILCVMTSSDCLTGTDRVAEVARKTDYDFYVNIQGDEPVIDLMTIDQVVEGYRTHKNAYAAYNLFKAAEQDEDPASPTMIKVTVNTLNELMYMSRHPVPFVKGIQPKGTYKQVCVYGFTREALEDFTSKGKGPVEAAEDIEILRFLEMGRKVLMIETASESISVDRPEDIVRVEEWLKTHGKK